MEILERGQRPVEGQHTVRCPWCQTVFRFTEQETRLVYSDKGIDRLMIWCPVCGEPAWTAFRPTKKD